MTKPTPSLIMVGVFFLLVAGATGFELLPRVIPLWYLIASLVTLAVFGWDKFRASRGGWRVAENTLHLLCLLGGWPGGLLGRALFRHKTQKQPFTAVFWATVVVNTLIFVSLLSPVGLQLTTPLRQLFG